MGGVVPFPQGSCIPVYQLTGGTGGWELVGLWPAWALAWDSPTMLGHLLPPSRPLTWKCFSSSLSGLWCVSSWLTLRATCQGLAPNWGRLSVTLTPPHRCTRHTTLQGRICSRLDPATSLGGREAGQTQRGTSLARGHVSVPGDGIWVSTSFNPQSSVLSQLTVPTRQSWADTGRCT